MRACSVAVVVPLGRRGYLQNVRDNFARQSVQEKRLVVVENGPAVGACDAAGFVPDALLTSEARPGLARNEGIDWVRRHGGGFFACFDDDDYYGPDYLEEALLASDRAEVVGKSATFVRTMAGTLRLFEQLGECLRVDCVAGPTIAGWSEAALPFPDCKCGEDPFWCEDMCRGGARLYATSRHNFMQCRYADREHAHAWRVSDDQMAQATRLPVYDVGPVDLDVVHGLAPEPFRRSVPKRALRPEDHPDWGRSGPLTFTREELAALLAECPT